MVWHVDNKTAPLVKPRKQPVFSQEVRHFTDEIGQTPTVPQADWFNMVQGELLGIADALNITRDKLDDNQIGNALKAKLSDAIPKTAITHETGSSKDKVASQFLVSEIQKAMEQALRQAIPVGFIANWPGETAPNEDWLIMRGQKYDRAKYSELYELLKTDTLPDGRGVMLRGLDSNRGFDPGRTLLSYQEDAMQKINGSVTEFMTNGSVATVRGSGYSGAFTAATTSIRNIISDGAPKDIDQLNRTRGIKMDSSLVTRSNTQNETVSKNIALNIIIKVK